MTSASELGKQVEALLRNYLEAGRREVEAVISRVQASSSSPKKGNFAPTRSKKTIASKPSTSRKQASIRRSSESVAALVEKVETAIRNQPGASIRDICREVQVEQNELARPMVILRETGKIRTVGARSQMRYFPALSSSSRRD